MYTNKTAEEWDSIAGTTDSYSKSTMQTWKMKKLVTGDTRN